MKDIKKNWQCKGYSYEGMLKRKYGMTLEDYAYLRHTIQFNACAICCSQLDDNYDDNGFKINSAHLDHCHKTGNVRGVLCSSCNHGIGNLKDSYINLIQAAQYIKQHNESNNI